MPKKLTPKLFRNYASDSNFGVFLCEKYLLESLQAYVLHGRFSVKAPVYKPGINPDGAYS